MKKLFLIFITFITHTIFLNLNLMAKAEIFPANNFKELQQTVINFGAKGQPHTLVVMDDDDTLTMMSCPNQDNENTCQYLGGPAWYSWQDNLLTTKSPFKVAENSEQLLDISALLLAMNDMVYTENQIPDILHSLTLSGVKLVVLTARGSSNLSATENQFSNLKFKTRKSKSQSFLSLISSNSLKGKKSEMPSIASPFQPKDCNAIRPISYQQGVMYVAGQNKGEMLKCLLNRTESSNIKNIVFIDDTLKNVEDVYASFENSKDYNVKAIHYTALQKHKAALTQGDKAKAYQQNAQNRWNLIKSALKEQLQNPSIN